MKMSERLEEINKNVLHIKKNSLTPSEIMTWSGWKSILPIFTEDLKYLQEQAERVEELEKELNFVNERRLHHVEQSKRYREVIYKLQDFVKRGEDECNIKQLIMKLTDEALEESE